MTISHILRSPDALLSHVFQFSSIKELVRLQVLSKQFKNLVELILKNPNVAAPRALLEWWTPSIQGLFSPDWFKTRHSHMVGTSALHLNNGIVGLISSQFHQALVHTVLLGSERLVSFADDDRAYIWDQYAHCVGTIPGGIAQKSCIVSDGSTIVSTSSEGPIRLLDLTKGKELAFLSCQVGSLSYQVDRIFPLPQERIVVAISTPQSSCLQSILKIYSMAAHKFEDTSIELPCPVSPSALYPLDTATALLGDKEGGLWIWRMQKKGAFYPFLSEHGKPLTKGQPISQIVYWPSQGWAATSCGSDRVIAVWDLAAAKRLYRFAGPETGKDNPLELIAIPDGRLIAYSRGGSTLKIYDLNSKKLCFQVTEKVRRISGAVLGFKPYLWINFRGSMSSSCCVDLSSYTRVRTIEHRHEMAIRGFLQNGSLVAISESRVAVIQSKRKPSKVS